MGLSCAIVVWLSYRHGNVPVDLRYFDLMGKGRLYHILAGGAPNFSRQAITSVASVLLNLVAANYSEALIAGMTITSRITALGYMLMIGFGQGFQPICAMNYGAKKHDRVKSALKITVCIGTMLLVAGTLVHWLYLCQDRAYSMFHFYLCLITFWESLGYIFCSLLQIW